MRTVFSLSRYIVFIGVIGLLIASFAVFIFGGIAILTVLVESFTDGAFDAEGAHLLSVELIGMIDLFLLGTILFITAIGLQELFVDPGLKPLLPEWISVSSLDELKFNLLAVIIVMLAVLFLGVAAEANTTGESSILEFGAGVSLVILAVSVAAYLFAKVHHMPHTERSHVAAEGTDDGGAEKAPNE